MVPATTLETTMSENFEGNSTPAPRGHWPDSADLEAAGNRVAVLGRQLIWASASLGLDKSDAEALAQMAQDAAEAADAVYGFAAAYSASSAAASHGGPHA